MNVHIIVIIKEIFFIIYAEWECLDAWSMTSFALLQKNIHLIFFSVSQITNSATIL